MSSSTDAVVTIVLFVALLGGVLFAFYGGFMLMMLGDGITSKRASWGVVVGVVGVPLSAIVTYVFAADLAWRANGYTFDYPIAALVVGGALMWGMTTLAEHIVTEF